MPFSQEVKDLVAYRAAYVCSNPDCLRLTAGPSLASLRLKVKIGEAAHIVGEKLLSARHQPLGDAALNDIANALWLCASCHTEIDKNSGIDFPTPLLKQWKADIEARISSILKTHQSPLPLYERSSSNSTIAQNVADIIGNHGAFFQQLAYENPSAVLDSVKIVRMKLDRQHRQVSGDTRLRSIVKALHDACREYMNENSVDCSFWQNYLTVLRARAGVQLNSLKREYGIQVPSSISPMLP
jgi:hypothetical protein